MDDAVSADFQMPQPAGLPDYELTSRLLKVINNLRAKAGLPAVRGILKGYPNDPCGCPIARTLVWGCQVPCWASADSSDLSLTVKDESVVMSLKSRSWIVQFMRDFDRFKYPDLVCD